MSYDIKNPDVWFLTTVEERNPTNVPRMRVMDGQYVNDGTGTMEPIDTTLNVSASNGPRQLNPVGTIFITRKLYKQVTDKGIVFYSTGKTNLIVKDTAATSEIIDAFDSYMKQIGATGVEDKESTLPSGKPTLISELLENYPVPTIEDHGFYVNDEVWACLLVNLHKGYNTMLVGQSGCGKTELTLLLARMMKKDIKVFDMSAKQDPIASLIGVHRFEGKSIFDRADFTYAIESDGIVVLDELPRAPMNTNNILFPVLDSRKELNMDIAFSGARTIKVNPECKFIATANEGFEYTGNNVMDRALKERFQLLLIDYMPDNKEVDLIHRRTGATLKDSRLIVKVASQIRVANHQSDLSSAVSVRHTLYASDLVEAGMSLSQAMEHAFLPMYTIEEERQKVKDMLIGR